MSQYLAPPLPKPVELMKVAELRAALQEKGLDTKGTKPVLVARLQEAIEAETKEPTAEPEKAEEETAMDESAAAFLRFFGPAIGLW